MEKEATTNPVGLSDADFVAWLKANPNTVAVYLPYCLVDKQYETEVLVRCFYDAEADRINLLWEDELNEEWRTIRPEYFLSDVYRYDCQGISGDQSICITERVG